MNETIMPGLKIFVCGMLICVIGGAAGGIVFDTLTKLSTCYYENQFETGELTIKHVWAENSNYFFSDTNGTIYKLDNYKGTINYDELPIVRFEKLHADDVYRCVYTEGKHHRLCISEVNMEAEK